MIQGEGKMRDKKELLAKEIFMKYYGSHFQMEREGEYSYYKSLNISKEQEKSWFIECRCELMLNIKKEKIVSFYFSYLASVIKRSKDIEGLELLLNIVREKRENSDTFSCILMAEELLRITESLHSVCNEKSRVIVDARSLALDVLRKTTEKPIKFDSYYLNLGYLKDILTEKKIKDRLQRLDDKWHFQST